MQAQKPSKLQRMIVDEEIQQDPVQETLNVSDSRVDINYKASSAKLAASLESLDDVIPEPFKVKESLVDKHIGAGNFTTEQVFQKQQYIREQQCKEAEATDRIMKHIVNDLREFGEKLVCIFKPVKN